MYVDPKALFCELPEAGVIEPIDAGGRLGIMNITWQFRRIHVQQQGNGVKQFQLLGREIPDELPHSGDIICNELLSVGQKLLLHDKRVEPVLYHSTTP